jgi:hypothetical protein
MNSYYFLVSALPPLKMGTKAEISYEEMEDLVDQNVHPRDRQKVSDFKQYIDLKNLRLLWMDLTIDLRGNLNRKELEAALLIHEFFPSFVFDFIEAYDDRSYRLNHFLLLLSKFLQYQSHIQKGFLRSYFQFEREHRAVLTALRARDTQRDLSEELQYEDANDFFIRPILAEKETTSYEPPQEYQELKTLYLTMKENPKNLFFSISEFSFRRVGEMKQTDPFSIDTVLIYMAQLLLVEDWEQMDEKKGKEIITSLF